MMDQARQQIQQRKEQIKQINPNILSAQVKEAEVNISFTIMQSSSSLDSGCLLVVIIFSN